MDLKKEIKLSDLFSGAQEEDRGREPKAEKPKKERKPLFGRKPKADQPPKERGRATRRRRRSATSVGRKKSSSA